MRARRAFMIDREGDTTIGAIRCSLVDHALTEQFVERLVHRGQAQISQCFGHEAGVNEVHLCMFNASAIEVHLHPMVGNGLSEGLVVVERIGVAKEVPGGVDERVHGIGFTAPRFTACRAICVHEGR